MQRCLSEKALVLLHSDEGSESDRAHLETCLSCARRYRELSNELGTIVAALKQPPPPLIPRHRFAYPRLGWSLAAAAIVLAFLCGRLTAFGVGSQSGVSFEPSSEPDSAEQVEPSIQWLEANNAGIAAPVSYGLYIDDLLTQDDPDQNPVIAAGSGDADSDEL
jgi:hypothetical protein